MPGKFLNEITADKPAKDDLGLFFDKSKNTTAQSSLVDIVAAGLDITSGKAGEAPVVIETVNPDGTKTQTLGWGKTGSSGSSAPPRPANATDLIITHDPASGTDGAATPAQVLTAGLPAGGNAGDALTLTSSGLAWGSSLPASTTGDKGKQLTVQADGKVAWSSDSSDLPAYTVLEAGKHLNVKADGKSVEWVAPELPTLTAGLDALQIKSDKSGVEWTNSVNMATNLKGGFTAGAFFPVNDVKADTTRFLDAQAYRRLVGVPEQFYFPNWAPVNEQVGAGWNDMGVALARMAAIGRADPLAGTGNMTKSAATFPGSEAYIGGVLLPNGKVFCVPAQAAQARVYDPVADTVAIPTGTFPGNYAYYGGVLLPNGKVFCVPHKATQARIYDPATDTVTTSTATFPGGGAHYGGVLLPNGKVFCVPHKATQARIYDPATDTVATSTATFPGSDAYIGGVLLPNGKVFCVPAQATQARVYDPVTDTVTIPTGTFPGNYAYHGGVLLPNGKVFCVPYNATQARIYDPVANTVSTPGGSFPGGYGAAGGVLLPNGKVFCVPAGSTQARVYDPVTDTVATTAGTYPGSTAYMDGVLLPNGKVFCVPHNATQAAIVDFQSMQVGGIPWNMVLSPFFNKL